MRNSGGRTGFCAVLRSSWIGTDPGSVPVRSSGTNRRVQGRPDEEQNSGLARASPTNQNAPKATASTVVVARM